MHARGRTPRRDDTEGSSQTPPERAGWRRKGSPAAGGRSEKAWTQPTRKDASGSFVSYRFKLAALGLLSVVLSGVLIAYLLYRPVKVPVVALAVTQYRAPIPPNAMALEDIERLGRAGPKNLDVTNLDIAQPTEGHMVRKRFWSLLKQYLSAVRPGGPGKNVIVLYVSAHGVVDEGGRPCLLLSDADPLDSSTWVPVSELLNNISSHDKLSAEPDTKTVLILDAGRMHANWSLGLLYNGFADQLVRAVEDAGAENLFVLNSAGPGQIGWSTPELAGSVFGYYVADGLRGGADSDDDGKVSLAELADYTRSNVDRWVAENRSSSQRPMLIAAGGNADFPVAHATDAGGPLSASAVAPPKARRETGARLWQRHEQARGQAPYRLDPLGWAELESGLVRLEQLMLAGKAYDDEFATTTESLETLLEQVVRDSSPALDQACSLPLVSLLGDISPALAESREIISRWTAPDPMPPPKQDEPPPPPSYLAAALAGRQWLSRQVANPTAADVQRVLEAVDTSQGRRGPDLVEIHFLRMLDAYLDGQQPASRIGRAIMARDLAERAAVPSDVASNERPTASWPDERAHYWVQQRVDQADQKRRNAEDLLFVGTRGALTEADRFWGELIGADGQSGQYGDAVRLGEQVARAYGRRDRAWATTAPLAQWVLDSLRGGQASELEDVLFQLIDQTHNLGILLREGAGQGQWTEAQEAAYSGVGTALESLEQAYSVRCDYLTAEAGEDRQTLRQIEQVLQVPALTGRDRNILRVKYLNILFATEGLAPTSTTAERSDASPDDGPTLDDNYLARLAIWPRHPALAILDRDRLNLGGRLRPARPRDRPSGADKTPEQSRAEQLDLLATQGGEVRKLLASVRPALRELVDQTDRAMEARRPELPTVVRTSLSKADRVTRAAAALLGRRTWQEAGDDPPRLLRNVDQHFQLLWHCRRTLDDFWGPPPAGEPEEYFAAVAEGYLASASGLCRGAGSLRYGEVDLRGLLESRRAAAAEGIQPEAPPIRLSQDAELVRHEIAGRRPPNLPPGRAAVYVDRLGPEGRLFPLLNSQGDPVRRRGVAIAADAGDSKLEHLVRNNAAIAGLSQLDAVALYRGHRWSVPFLVEAEGRGDEIAYERPVYGKPRVRVGGPAKQTSSVMFIFDCSGSMSTRIAGGGRRRIVVARDTLNTILAKLPDNRYRVGLMLYGHRVGWKKQRQSDGTVKYVKDPPDVDRHPSTDVEHVLETKALLNATVRQSIAGILAPLKPRGETPLYLALTQAIEDFRPDDRQSSAKHIIVITDGINDQSSDGPAAYRKQRDDVDAMLGRQLFQGIQIDIVGLDMAAARRNNPKDVADLKAIAERTGGAFHEANDPTSLLKALERSLGLVEYHVYKASGRPPARVVLVERTWNVEDWDQREAPYIVRLVGMERSPSAPVTLAGGEALDMFYNKRENRLEHRRFAPKEIRERRESVPDPADPRRNFFIAAHLPRRVGNGVWFPVSVQNAEERLFSPRPKHVWAEIRPLANGPARNMPVYHFYDVEVEPDRPVPVLRFRVPNWPAEARRAEIRLWLKVDDDAPPNRTISVDDLRRASLPAPGIEGVTFHVEPPRDGDRDNQYVVRLTQQHEAGSDLYAVRVQITPPPDRVSHRYVAQSNVVRHLFVYNRSVGTTPKIHITSRERITRNAVAITEPLEVTLPRD